VSNAQTEKLIIAYDRNSVQIVVGDAVDLCGSNFGPYRVVRMVGTKLNPLVALSTKYFSHVRFAEPGRLEILPSTILARPRRGKYTG